MSEAAFSDIHRHLLYGIDDGPRTPEQMYMMLRQDVSQGIETVYATVHSNALLRPNGLKLYQQRLNEAREYCERSSLPIRIQPGCEIRYFDSAADLLAKGALLPLGNTRYALIEFNFSATPEQIGQAADSLYSAGFTPVVAHAERIGCLLYSPKRAIELKERYDLYYQVNCESVYDPRGFFQRRFIRRLLSEQAADAIATDAHDPASRPVNMKTAYDAVCQRYSKDYADRLTGFGQRIGEQADKP